MGGLYALSLADYLIYVLMDQQGESPHMQAEQFQSVLEKGRLIDTAVAQTNAEKEVFLGVA